MERVGYVAPFESSENYRLRVGDILFSNINSVEYIGNTAFIDKDYDLYHGMNLLRLTPNHMVVIPFYLYLLLNTNRMLNHFKAVCNKAVSQARINQTELGKTVVQIPPINTQEQICELYQALYTKLETESHTKSLFQNQKQYMLHQMFIWTLGEADTAFVADKDLMSYYWFRFCIEFYQETLPAVFVLKSEVMELLTVIMECVQFAVVLTLKLYYWSYTQKGNGTNISCTPCFDVHQCL